MLTENRSSLDISSQIKEKNWKKASRLNLKFENLQKLFTNILRFFLS
jgi:hypothetical protein